MDRRPPIPAHTPDDDRRRELLRQLRDLDDDLAAGKLTEADHARLRDPVERAAAAAVRRRAQRPAGGAAAVTSSTRLGSATSGSPQGGDADGRTRRRRSLIVTLLALAGVAAGTTILLVSAVSSRHPGQTITGNSVAGTASAGNPSGLAPASQSGHRAPTTGQLAAVAAAEAQVRQNPKDVSAHLALAEAYAAAGASQAAAVEYLAVTRLDPTNAEANTNLALLAFEVGQPAQGKIMVDRVLAANPNYPEALYVRGLIDLIGLRQPKVAERDFSAYLAVAPFGSHRTAAATLLVLAQGQDHR